MAYEIVWTPEARRTFFGVIEYLQTSFSEREINRFVERCDMKIDLIITNPNIYRRSSKVSNVHFSNILGKVLIVYQVMPRKKQIVIIKFWDGRQNPNDFKY